MTFPPPPHAPLPRREARFAVHPAHRAVEQRSQQSLRAPLGGWASPRKPQGGLRGIWWRMSGVGESSQLQKASCSGLTVALSLESMACSFCLLPSRSRSWRTDTWSVFKKSVMNKGGDTQNDYLLCVFFPFSFNSLYCYNSVACMAWSTFQSFFRCLNPQNKAINQQESLSRVTRNVMKLRAIIQSSNQPIWYVFENLWI